MEDRTRDLAIDVDNRYLTTRKNLLLAFLRANLFCNIELLS